MKGATGGHNGGVVPSLGNPVAHQHMVLTHFPMPDQPDQPAETPRVPTPKEVTNSTHVPPPITHGTEVPPKVPTPIDHQIQQPTPPSIPGKDVKMAPKKPFSRFSRSVLFVDFFYVYFSRAVYRRHCFGP